MKKIKLFVLSILLVGFFVGCNGNQENTVENPPEFVEMYLNQPSVLQPTDYQVKPVGEMVLVDEELTSDTVYDGVLMSNANFEVVVVTSGLNYDLLFSVEVIDSLLGTCIYTDQSTLYVASSTVTVETDGSYTTTTILTIPASTGVTTYLSERTISLTKILFTRDTANGTFPADIPDNSTTLLQFEIHASVYFDTTIGLPLEVNNGKVDIILTPDSSYFAQAQTLAKTIVVIPDTVNGYDIGSIILWDLSWIENLTVTGASQDVFIMGDFSVLTSLTFDKINNESLVNHKFLTINGVFPVLTEMDFFDVTGYSTYISFNEATENAMYLNYISDAGTTPYAFPVLETIWMEEVRIDLLRIGNDSFNIPFPGLTEVSVNGFTVNHFEFGNESNSFPKLEAININDCDITVSEISGSKPEDELAAVINFDNQLASNNYLYLEGSVFSTVIFTDSLVYYIEINDGNILPSRLAEITLTNCTITENGGSFLLFGSHPNLLNLSISDVNFSQIKIGGIGSEFAALTQISISGVDCWSITIGDRDVEFSALEHLIISTTQVGNNLYIGGENALFPVLLDISISDSSANNLTIGYFGGSFNDLGLILLEELQITEALTISGNSFLSIDTIALKDITSGSANFYPQDASYNLYIDNCVFTLALSIQTSVSSICQAIYLPEVDVTTWVYYDAISALGITMETGTYTPA
ncbi:MAG: hypothetical protein WCX25_01335 [Candidatus Izemoplasmatales bacterium]